MEMIGFGLAAVAAGVCYVMVHEARRKRKKAEKLARDSPISKELLLQILNKSAEASKAVIERVQLRPTTCGEDIQSDCAARTHPLSQSSVLAHTPRAPRPLSAL